MKKIIISTIIIGLLLMSSMASVNGFVLEKETQEMQIEQCGSVPVQQAEWTIMVYLNGDTSLEVCSIDIFLEMAQVGSTDDINIIVQLDRSPGDDTRYGDWTTAKRFRITQGMIPDNESALMDIGEVCMADSQTLIDFICWAKDNFSAEHYCLILFDHGLGWYSWGFDLDPYADKLEMPEIKNVLCTITGNGSNPLDLFVFHSCLMGMLEVAYEIADYCRYMTASEEVTGPSWNYNEIFGFLVENPAISPETLGVKFVSYHSYDNTLSTINLSLVKSLGNAVSDLGGSLQKEEYHDEILNADNAVKDYSCTSFVDLYHLTQLLKQFIDENDIDAKAQTVMDQIDATVVACTNCPNSHGLSIFVPRCDYSNHYPYRTYNPDYENLLFAQYSQWDEFLLWYLSSINIKPPDTPTIDGPISGHSGKSYGYTFDTFDPDGDFVYYYIDWGDGCIEEWIGPYGIPFPAYQQYDFYKVTLSHIYNEKGTYIIKAKAKDIFNKESEWSTLEVTMPKNTNCDIQSSSASSSSSSYSSSSSSSDSPSSSSSSQQSSQSGSTTSK